MNDTLRRSLKSQMKDANRLKAKYSIIIGEEELKREMVSIKNMETKFKHLLEMASIKTAADIRSSTKIVDTKYISKILIKLLMEI